MSWDTIAPLAALGALALFMVLLLPRLKGGG